MKNDYVWHRILIVDDMPENIKILGEALRDEYKVSVANNGERALKIATSNYPPDLILLDIMMPKMDGYEVCRRLKSDARTRNISVIFITTRDTMEDETKGFELGAVDYITKPFSMPIVLARVRTHLRLKRQTDILEKLISLDSLTEIPNRRRFDEVLRKEWSRAQRVSRAISLIMIDIDFFRKFNEHYGQAVGDECLRKVARTLQNSISRAADLIARYGGEEFVVLLPETYLESAMIVADKIRLNIENLNIPHSFSPVTDHVTVSLGVAATVPTNNASPNDLIEAADQALQRAKNGGRNQVKRKYFIKTD